VGIGQADTYLYSPVHPSPAEIKVLVILPDRYVATEAKGRSLDEIGIVIARIESAVQIASI
jgi:hypothetical protein